MKFPKNLIIRAINQEGYPLRIAGLQFQLILYQLMDGFWSRGGTGFTMNTTNDNGITSISMEEVQKQFEELQRGYPMDFKTPLDKYKDFFSVVLNPHPEIRILNPDSKIRKPSIKRGRVGNSERPLPVQDYSLEGIQEADTLSIDFVTSRIDDPFISYRNLTKLIENENQIDHILSILSARKRIGSYLELYGMPFCNVYDSPFFITNMHQISGSISLDYSDQSGANEITVCNPYSYYEIADEIGIYAQKIELVWAHVPEGLRKEDMKNRKEMTRISERANNNLIGSIELPSWSKNVEKKEFETDAPTIKINFGSLFTFRYFE